jgi:hypothetical protein
MHLRKSLTPRARIAMGKREPRRGSARRPSVSSSATLLALLQFLHLLLKLLQYSWMVIGSSRPAETVVSLLQTLQRHIPRTFRSLGCT